MDRVLSVSGKQGIEEGILGEVGLRFDKPDDDARDVHVNLQVASLGFGKPMC
jgi:hypothetical protein